MITVRDLDALDTPAVVVALRPAPHATDSAAQRPLDSSPTGPSSPAEQRAALGQWCTAPGADARSRAAVPGAESSASARPAVDAWPTPSSAAPPGRLARHRRRCQRRRRSRAEQRAAPRAPGPPGSTRPPAVASRWRSGRPWRWPSPRERHRRPRRAQGRLRHPEALPTGRGPARAALFGRRAPSVNAGILVAPNWPAEMRHGRLQIAADCCTERNPGATATDPRGCSRRPPPLGGGRGEKRQPAVSVVASRHASERP